MKLFSQIHPEPSNSIKKSTDAWTGQDGGQTSLSRPSSLFPGDSSYSHQDVKDLYLQDLSDSKLSCIYWSCLNTYPK